MDFSSYETNFGGAQHFYLADHIVVLGNDGNIAQQGTYDSLRSQQGYISSILLKPGPSSNHSSTTGKQILGSKSLKGPSNDNVMDLTRKTGDMAVYSKFT